MHCSQFFFHKSFWLEFYSWRDESVLVLCVPVAEYVHISEILSRQPKCSNISSMCLITGLLDSLIWLIYGVCRQDMMKTSSIWTCTTRNAFEIILLFKSRLGTSTSWWENHRRVKLSTENYHSTTIARNFVFFLQLYRMIVQEAKAGDFSRERFDDRRKFVRPINPLNSFFLNVSSRIMVLLREIFAINE